MEKRIGLLLAVVIHIAGAIHRASRRLLERVKIELLEIRQVAELLRDGTCAAQETRGNKLVSVAIGFDWWRYDGARHT